MKKILILLPLLLLFSCQMKVVPSKWTGKTAYTKHGFFYEKNRHLTTNYIRGLYVPAGTEVKVNLVGSKQTSLSINGNIIQIINYEKHTNNNMEGVLDRMLSASKYTPKVSSKYKTNLKTGQPSVGMTKDEVIAVIGYPPAHRTYSLDENSWTYWWSRFDTKKLIFDDKGKLNLIQD